MAALPREPEAFGEQVLAILHRHWPKHNVILSGPFDLMVNGRHLGLENLYRMVLGSPDRGTEIVEDYLEKIFEGDDLGVTPIPWELAKLRVMPRIQPDSIFQQLNQAQVAHVPWVNGTVIVFVLDMPQVTVSITVEQVIHWGTSMDELDAIARTNLERYSPDLQIQVIESQDGGRAALLGEHDGYDASRVLLGKLHARLAPELDGDFFVAMPSRDMFVAMTANPEHFVDRLRKRVDQDYKRLPYPITRELFLVTRDGVAGTAA
ncbi:MAG: DUF1444 family protein [Planctomycetota bacterium]|jgi:hypothetical protein|nr:DUF1444 family protein [Planctomycetota bacterium]MDA1025299.1 DUF1444 family protein [Planctomycetota bacterium]